MDITAEAPRLLRRTHADHRRLAPIWTAGRMRDGLRRTNFARRLTRSPEAGETCSSQGRPSGWSARRLDRRHESPKVVMTQRAASTSGPDREEPDVAL